MDAPPPSSRLPQVLLVVLLAGFALWQGTRIVFNSGLPISHDEPNYLIEALRLPAQGRLTGYVHGPLVYELMAIMEIGWFALGKVMGTVATPTDHLASMLANMAPHLVAGRMVILLAALVCLVAVFRVGRLLAGEWAGLLAATLCATSLTFAVFTSTVKEDVFLWLLFLVSAELMWRTSPEDRRRPFLAGLCIGAAFSAKYFGLFGMTLALLPLLRWGRPRARMALRQAAFFTAGAGMAVLVLFPFLIYDLGNVLGSLRRMSDSTSASATELGFVPYLFTHLPSLMGPVVALAALFELGLRLRSDRRGPHLLFMPALLILVFLAARPGLTMSYYVFPVAMVGFLLAAAFAIRLWTRLPRPWRALPPAALVAMALFDPAFLPSTVKYGLLFAGPDTRALAGDKIKELVPAGECVVATGGIVGFNQFGPDIAPTQAQSANPSGSFAAAERAAVALRPPPHHRLQLVERYRLPEVIPPDCDFLVEGRIGEQSSLELGPVSAEPPPPVAPPGFETIWQVRAVPELHSRLYPYMTVLDLEELREISIARLWRERKLGSSYVIHRRVEAP